MNVNTFTTCAVTYPETYITSEKNRLRVYPHGKIYLRDHQEYEIEFLNNSSDTFLAKIKLDGNYISEGGLVLRPGEHVFLDRFLKIAKKFTFQTYSVPKSSKKYIKENGELRIEFFRKMIRNTYVTFGPPYYIKPSWPDVCPRVTPPFWYHEGTTTTGGASVYNSTTLTNYSSNAPVVNTSMLRGSVETGITEKGEDSDQQLVDVNEEFESFCGLTKVFKLLPISTKPISVKEIKKVVCPACKTKIKKGWQFCPTCSRKV